MRKIVTFHGLIKSISKATGISEIKVKDVLVALVKEIYTETLKGNCVSVAGLGKFDSKEIKGKIKDNKYIPRKRLPVFTASPAYKEVLQKERKKK